MKVTMIRKAGKLSDKGSELAPTAPSKALNPTQEGAQTSFLSVSPYQYHIFDLCKTIEELFHIRHVSD